MRIFDGQNPSHIKNLSVIQNFLRTKFIGKMIIENFNR